MHRQPPLLSVGDLLEDDESSHSTARSTSPVRRAPPERERGRNDGVDLAFCGTSAALRFSSFTSNQTKQQLTNQPSGGRAGSKPSSPACWGLALPLTSSLSLQEH